MFDDFEDGGESLLAWSARCKAARTQYDLYCVWVGPSGGWAQEMRLVACENVLRASGMDRGVTNSHGISLLTQEWLQPSSSGRWARICDVMDSYSVVSFLQGNLLPSGWSLAERPEVEAELVAQVRAIVDGVRGRDGASFASFGLRWQVGEESALRHELLWWIPGFWWDVVESSEIVGLTEWVWSQIDGAGMGEVGRALAQEARTGSLFEVCEMLAGLRVADEGLYGLSLCEKRGSRGR